MPTTKPASISLQYLQSLKGYYEKLHDLEFLSPAIIMRYDEDTIRQGIGGKEL